MEYKGGMIEFNAPTIIITSNLDPSDWYINDARASRDALARRLTKVIHMTTKYTYRNTIRPYIEISDDELA